MKTGDRNLRVAVLKAIADAINDAVTAEREEHLGMLVEAYDDDGMKSFDVRLPADVGGERVKVATISLAIPADSIDVTDEAALKTWAETNGPTMLKTDAVPATVRRWVPPSPGFWIEAEPARTETVLDRSAVAVFIKAMKPGPAGTVVDPSTGQIVEGLTHKPGGRPKSFSVRYAPDGREELARAWRNGHLEHVLDQTPLPAIGGES